LSDSTGKKIGVVGSITICSAAKPPENAVSPRLHLAVTEPSSLISTSVVADLVFSFWSRQ
jgi:hypothetical protein